MSWRRARENIAYIQSEYYREARQTSEEQIKMPRLMLEGPGPCTILSLVHYTWIT